MILRANSEVLVSGKISIIQELVKLTLYVQRKISLRLILVQRVTSVTSVRLYCLLMITSVVVATSVILGPHQIQISRHPSLNYVLCALPDFFVPVELAAVNHKLDHVPMITFVRRGLRFLTLVLWQEMQSCVTLQKCKLTLLRMLCM